MKIRDFFSNKKIQGKISNGKREFDICTLLFEKPLEKEKSPRHIKSDIFWFLPEVPPFSGGITTIMRIADGLQRRGIENKIILINRKNAEFSKKNVFEILTILNSTWRPEIYVYKDVNCEGRFGIATFWTTVYFLHECPNILEKIYFVQDYEPFFYPLSSEYVFCENTYDMIDKFIVAGSWLKLLLERKKKEIIFPFELAVDTNTYQLNVNIRREENLVVHFIRPRTKRRALELSIASLKFVKDSRPDIKIGLFGADMSDYNIPFKYDSYGILKPKDLSNLYNKATLGYVASLTNYSLVNKEMMACRLPVVDINGENTATIFKNGEDILLAEKSREKIAETILQLIDDHNLRNKISEEAYKRVIRYKWDNAIDDIMGAFL